MTLVKKTHGWNKADALSLALKRAAKPGKLVWLYNTLHLQVR
jgi:hypothetical protein